MATSNATAQPPASAAFPLLDRVAIVTGASRGIGSSIAEHLAILGARVVINYVSNSAPAETLAAQINSSTALSSLSTPRALAVRSDVSDPAQVKALFDAAEAAFNVQPHILVTSAGVTDSTYSSIADMPVEEFDRIFAVNARGTFACLQEAAKRLRRGGGGRIITVSTSLAAMYRPGYGAYTASKAAVETLTKILAKELKGTGITANCVAPGPIATELFFAGKSEGDVKRFVDLIPMGRLGETKDIPPVIGFLATDSGEWVNGQVIRVNGGAV